jgi:hypothetical protein
VSVAIDRFPDFLMWTEHRVGFLAGEGRRTHPVLTDEGGLKAAVKDDEGAYRRRVKQGEVAH